MPIPNLNRRWPRPLALAILAIVLVIMAGIGQGRAAAQNTPYLTSMAVSVMPEYDQPRVLVSYRGEFDSGTSFPLQARLLLPADTDIEHVCSIKQPDEEHICQPYTTDPEGQYLAVTWEAVTPIMYVEYYYGSVSGAGGRSLDFTFLPPYSVENLDLFVLEPVDATDFALSPDPADTVEEQGFRHHSYSYQDLTVDKPVIIEMVYARETDQPQAPPQVASADDGGSGIPQSLVIALGLAGGGVLALVLYSVFSRRFRTPAVAPAGRVPAIEATAPQGDAGFCRHCGGTVRQGSSFCPACGQEVGPPTGKQG